MAPTSLRPAFILAVLLSLTCNAIAAFRPTPKSLEVDYEDNALSVWKYQASSTLSSKTGGLTGSCNLNASVTATTQTTSFVVRVMGAKGATAASFSPPSYYKNSTGSLVAQFPCTFQAEATSGNWNCTINASVQLGKYQPLQPVGAIKSLVDAGVFGKPSDFYVVVNVTSVAVLKGSITASAKAY